MRFLLKTLLSHYVGRARAEQGVTFVGRLGTYRYLDMHIAIAEALEALEAAKHYVASLCDARPMPAFLVEPSATAVSERRTTQERMTHRCPDAIDESV